MKVFLAKFCSDSREECYGLYATADEAKATCQEHADEPLAWHKPHDGFGWCALAPWPGQFDVWELDTP
jgi:hypothetical protein